jgi:hypothetical protein
MMKRILALALACSLAACATPYDPNIQDVTNPAQVAADKAHCAALAKGYKRQLSVAGVATSGAQGASGNLSSIPITGYLGPLLGGVGGALGNVFQWAGLIDVDTPRADQACIRQTLDRDHAGILVEPPL